MPPMLTVKLLGQPSLDIDGQPVKGLRLRADTVLYYCLAVGRPVTDGELFELFWPGEGQGAAQRLSEAIYNINTPIKNLLRQAGVPDPANICVRDLRQRTVTFSWPPTTLDYDVARFEALVKTMVDTPSVAASLPTLEQAYALYQRGPFLGTLPVATQVDFEIWITTVRTRLEDHYLKLLRPLSMHYMARGAWTTALELLESLQQSLPEAEDVYGLLMVGYAAVGNILQARATYRQYVEMVGDVYHHAPNSALTQLHKIIQDGRVVPLQVTTLVARALEIKHRLMHDWLRRALEAVFEATGVAWTPVCSPRYHQAVHQAEAEARQHGDSLIGTPHLFFALSAIAPRPFHDTLLESSRVSLEAVVQTLRDVLRAGAPTRQPRTGQTLPLQHVLREAQTRAKDMEADMTDVQHLWVALLQEERSLLSQVLTRYGVDRSQVLEAIEAATEEVF